MLLALVIQTVLLVSVFNMTYHQTTLKILITITFLFILLYRNISKTDEETKQKAWFKAFVIYMKVLIGVSIILASGWIIGEYKFYD